MIRKRLLFQVFILMIISSFAFGQEFGPKPVKSFDPKIIKNKILLIPEYEQVVSFIKPGAFAAFEADKKVDGEYQKRWDEAMKTSSWDFSDYKITRTSIDRMKKDKDKSAIILFFDKDFYKNEYAYIAVTDPEYRVIATAPINNFDLSSVDDIRLMMNILTFSMVDAGKLYDPQMKELYKGHKFIYRKNLKIINDSIKKKIFLIPMYVKGKNNFNKLNEKISNFLKDNWKISDYDFIEPQELANRISAENFDGYYLKSIPVYTSNELMTYYYFVVISHDNTVFYGLMGEKDLSPATLKYIHTNMPKWFADFSVQPTTSGDKNQKTYEKKKPEVKTDTKNKDTKQK